VILLGCCSDLKHQNLLELIGICTKPLALVTDYLELGALHNYLHVPTAPRLSWRYRVRVALDIAKGMYYLHSEDILHHDLRSPNILVASLSDDAEVVAKVADFGMSVIYSPELLGGDFNECWTAPEIFKGEKASLQVDVYSYGIILWELLQLGFPFAEYSGTFAGKPRLDFLDAVVNGLRPLMPSGTPKKYASLVNACWALSPHDRPTFATIVDRLQSMLPECSSWKQLK
jgi:serine/threonine protein kinase